MKILYIGHYRQGSTGWAQVTKNHIKSLLSVGVDVACRPVLLQGSTDSLDEDILACERKSTEDCDICIQHVLPHHLVYDGRFKKNIAIYMSETTHRYTNWANYLNMMDEVWVSNNEMKEQATYNRINVPVKVVPHGFDMSRYSQRFDPVQWPELVGNYVFYFIGELVRRKHLVALLRAFHSEFTRSDCVTLVLKLGLSGASQATIDKEFGHISEQVKRTLNLYDNLDRYNTESIVSGHLSDDDILRLHNSCDCFVCPAYGEAWSIPAFEAASIGNYVIATDCGGPKDYLPKECLVPGRIEPIIGMLDTIPGFGKSHEYWWNIDMHQLRRAMRSAYASNKDLKKFSPTLQKYSLENVGKHMVSYLT